MLFTTVDSVYREQYCRVLSVLFCICVLAFVCLGFVVNNISSIPTETNFVPFESELLLRSELSVVTLGKSLPGNCSKLGHLFPWAFLSIIFLTSQLKIILYLFPFESGLLLRSELSDVALDKSIPGNGAQQIGVFVCLGFLINSFSYIPIKTNFVFFSSEFLLFVVELLLRT